MQYNQCPASLFRGNGWANFKRHNSDRGLIYGVQINTDFKGPRFMCAAQ